VIVHICGIEIQIDEQDIHILDSRRFSLLNARGKKYLQTTSYKNRNLLHRIILEAKKGEHCDHINGDTLDNRRLNLRICSHAQNMANRKISKNNKTGVKGVYLVGNGIFRAEIRKNSKKFSKSFNDIENARLWVIEKSKELHGEFVNLDWNKKAPPG
jgi:hypothetical protein